jgi:hypothetical protein
VTSTELVHVPRAVRRRRSNARRYIAGAILGVSDVIRGAALLAIGVLCGASVDPHSAWNPHAPAPAIAVIVLALLGVERIGLAVRELSEAIAHPMPHTPRRPQHPAH